MPKKVIVIGGGIGGLASAALLAKDGYSVTLLERNLNLGGRARSFTREGFIFDMGPSWYMMPEIFDRFFSYFDSKTSDFYQLIRLKTHYKVFFEDKTTITINYQLKKNLKTFSRFEKNGGEKLKLFLQESKQIYDIALKNLVLENYRSPFSLLKPSIIANFFKFDLLTSFHQYIKKFFDSPYLQKILEFTTVFLGGSPYNTPAFYRLIAHADLNLGIYHPLGGINKIVEALTKLCLKNRVTIKKGVVAQKIEVDKKTKTAFRISTNKGQYYPDIVVVNADYHHSETHLLPPEFSTYNENYWHKSTMSPSAFLIYLGIKGKIPQLEHHNLFFSSNWETHFTEVYQRKIWPKNPSYYIHCPSKTDSSLAPKNCETVIILVPVAAGLQDTKQIKNNFYEKIIDHLEKLIELPLKKRIIIKKIFTITDFVNAYNAYKGAAFGLAHTLTQTAFFRPKNFSRKVKNLYYVGQYTNPGVGMPIVILSAQIVHHLVKNDFPQ